MNDEALKIDWQKIDEENAKINAEIRADTSFQRFIKTGERFGFKMRSGTYCDGCIHGTAIISNYRLGWFYYPDHSVHWNNKDIFHLIGYLLQDKVAEEQFEEQLKNLGNFSIDVCQSTEN